MNQDELFKEIDIKYGELLEMLTPYEVPTILMGILINMLIETRNNNEYLKKRIDACQRYNNEQKSG